jgi:hypothetical protein
MVTSMPIAAALVAMTNAAMTRSNSPLKTTRVARSLGAAGTVVRT